jgi:ABC-type iron transport system FetAB ATPase subunit
MSAPLRRVLVAGRPSARLLRMCAAFGLVARRAGAAPAPDAGVLHRAERCLGRGGLVLLTGPSGCGKSTLVRMIARRARTAGTRVVGPGLPRADRTLIDAFPGTPARAMRALVRAGLGEPMLWARRAGELSEGERSRLGLALALVRAEAAPRGRRVLLVFDEWGASLDRASALAGARALRRAARTGRGRAVGVVCASPRGDLAGLLDPDLTLRGSLGGGGWTTRSRSTTGHLPTTRPSRGSTTARVRRPDPCACSGPLPRGKPSACSSSRARP